MVKVQSLVFSLSKNRKLLKDPAIAGALAALRDARRVLFITGAGISADSGLPTYRGIGGLYEDAGTDDGMPIETALSGEMLQTEPGITWKYIAQIESACRGARHNAAHEVIAKLEKTRDVCVLTQNIDGFHRDAGSKNLIEMHGNFHGLACTACDYQTTVADYSALHEMPPRCPQCQSLLRPQIVLFGEMLPAAALEHYYQEMSRGFDVIFSIGTTSVFPYIAGPVIEAGRADIPTVEINPGRSEVSGLVSHRIRYGAKDVLSAIMESL